jgi:hypothetical protein
MNGRDFAVIVLTEKGETTISCNGNSMRPIIAPKEKIHLKRVLPEQLRIGDAVLCRIKSGLTVHKITAIDGDRHQISNNHGHVNGWIGAKCIYGLAVKIEDRVLVSDEELEKRKL